MIFYQGKGYLIYWIPICAIIFCALFFEKTNFRFYSCLIITVLELVLAYNSYKEHKGNPYKYLDKQTGEEIFVEHKNTLYWIKAEYWAVFIAIASLLGLIFT